MSENCIFLNVGFGKANLSAASYAKIPMDGGALIIQWGRAGMTSNAGTPVTFYTAFPNACVSALVNDTGTGCVPCAVGALTKTGMTIYAAGKAYSSAGNLNDVTSGTGFTYFAIGW